MFTRKDSMRIDTEMMNGVHHSTFQREFNISAQRKISASAQYFNAQREKRLFTAFQLMTFHQAVM